MNNLKLARQ